MRKSLWPKTTTGKRSDVISRSFAAMAFEADESSPYVMQQESASKAIAWGAMAACVSTDSTKAFDTMHSPNNRDL